MEPQIKRLPVSYQQRLAPRSAEQIDLLVLHCTELPDLESARRYAEQIHYTESQTGACGHLYVAKSGSVFEYVDPLRVAHHCVGYNERSIGIELDNLGRYPDWHHLRHQSLTDPYPEAQIQSLIALIEHLQGQFPKLHWMAGHEQLDTRLLPAADDPESRIRRKVDPGPLFPWGRMQAHFAGRLLHAVPSGSSG
jgi:N-acetylmuramoyl-L-alanine amidase